MWPSVLACSACRSQMPGVKPNDVTWLDQIWICQIRFGLLAHVLELGLLSSNESCAGSRSRNRIEKGAGDRLTLGDVFGCWLRRDRFRNKCARFLFDLLRSGLNRGPIRLATLPLFFDGCRHDKILELVGPSGKRIPSAQVRAMEYPLSPCAIEY